MSQQQGSSAMCAVGKLALLLMLPHMGCASQQRGLMSLPAPAAVPDIVQSLSPTRGTDVLLPSIPPERRALYEREYVGWRNFQYAIEASHLLPKYEAELRRLVGAKKEREMELRVRPTEGAAIVLASDYFAEQGLYCVRLCRDCAVEVYFLSYTDIGRTCPSAYLYWWLTEQSRKPGVQR